jgi:hypothetical protein
VFSQTSARRPFDLANCIWEISRLRRAKAAIINLAFENALCEVLSSDWDDARVWARGHFIAWFLPCR